MPTRGEQIAQALDAFLQGCTDVEGAAVVSVDGLPMASALPMHVEEDRLAAMAAAMLSLGEKASEGLSRGKLSELHLEGAAGTVHLMAAGPQAVFCAICRDGAKTGLVLFEMTSAADRIAAALAAPQPQAQIQPPPLPAPPPQVAQAGPSEHVAPRPASRQSPPAPAPVGQSPRTQTPVPAPVATTPAQPPVAVAAPRPAPVPAPPEGATPAAQSETPTSTTTAPTPVPGSSLVG